MKTLAVIIIAGLSLIGCGPKNTFEYEGNPLIRDKYTADPAPMVASDGRLYLICGHDECFEDRPGYEGKYGFNITEWVCYSTEDMQTWTDHGVIMKPTDFTWSIGEAWASQVVEGADGKYYFYVSTQCGDPNCKAVGVAVSDSPTGPFLDAIGRPLIEDSMTDNGERGWWNDFDPTVMIDDDGTPWMSWGNGTCFLVKLKKNMVELDGEIMVLPMENYVEGPWLYKRDGHYYNVYASMGHPLETISYAMADNVEGPWTFMGELTGMAKDSFTIHPGVIEFKGKNYLFYHNSTLSIDGYGPATGRRSVCVDEMFYNPDGTIKPVVQTRAGIKTLKPADKGAFETRRYRNVFVEAGYFPEQVDAKVNQVFEEVFFGPDKVYFEVEDSLAYVSDIKNNDVRTEGMSYGMMIAVQMDRKDIFDKLFRWCKKYMQHSDGPYEGYFAWSCKTDGTRNSQGPASDGELYYVTSLLFASNRWGNDTGIDYKSEAQYILDCAFAKNDTTRINNFINTDHKLITFTPDQFGYTFTDPSYHIPAFYEVWAMWADDGRADFWKECAAASREYLHKAIHEQTGLNSDYSNYDGSIRMYKGSHFGTGNFRYDSWRVPMNIAMDYSWSCADKQWQREYGEKIQRFFYEQGINDYVDQYRIDGTMPSEDEILPAGSWDKALRHSVGLVSTLGAASLLTEHAINKEFVDALWNSENKPYEDGYFDAYYDGLLRLFAFMHLSGKYQIIFPE